MSLGRSLGTEVKLLFEQSTVVELLRHIQNRLHFVELDVLIGFTFITVSKQIASSTVENVIPR